MWPKVKNLLVLGLELGFLYKNRVQQSITGTAMSQNSQKYDRRKGG